MEDLILFGCGGFSLEVTEYFKDCQRHVGESGNSVKISDIIDAQPGRYDEVCGSLGYTPNLVSDITSVEDRGKKRVLICLGDAMSRHRRFRELKNAGFVLATLIHPTAWIASNATIEEGTIVCPFAFVGPKSTIGENCLINVRATIGHDVQLGESTVISPHACLSGASSCGAGTFVGSGAIVDPGKKVGAYSKVASSAVVKRSFGDGFLVAGNPANGRQMYKIPDS